MNRPTMRQAAALAAGAALSVSSWVLLLAFVAGRA